MMEKVKVLVVEDREEDAAIIENALTEMSYEVMNVADSIVMATKMLEEHVPDVAILDIHLGSTMDGITLAHRLNEDPRFKIPFIFLTSASDKATFAAAKSSKPSGYLIKPFNPLELDYAIELAIENFYDAEGELDEGRSALVKDFFYVKHNKALVKLATSAISHVKVSGRYSELYHEGKRFLCRKSLVDLMTLFPKNQFIRTHRNYLANISFVDNVVVSESSVYLTNGVVLPVSSSQLEAVKALFPLLT